MTPARLKVINKYWTKHPPVAWLIAAQMSYKPPSDVANQNVMRAPKSKGSPKNLDTLAAMFGLKPGTKVSM